MKTKKDIERELKIYEGIETFDYMQNPMPMGEWAMYQDIGYRKALKWVLDIETKE